ncbi:hypothetical protein BCR37DRAFT_377841 [Protomyces lactucae-debilis]|uniref:Uncharacterized protein n=1 Tax=Protomyces lactucae-debilis TaxID=2754530 RepID=A0A1Y2FMW7_PROLT|nr:uncharacterized protein BCR37DRAFT_377841 [Protomyces lactucae-debilis]ORY84927.1 hypothetical protein BCR37DRAFT_377841 [Protomyces lactucae-debilis]
MKKLRSFMSFLYLLGFFFMIYRMETAAMRGSSSGSTTETGLRESSKKNKQASEQNSERRKRTKPDDSWERNDRQCYHLRVHMKAILSKNRRLTEKACENRCKESLDSHSTAFHNQATQWKTENCYQSKLCVASRNISMIAPVCAAEQAMANPVCHLAECACAATVNIWRIKQYGNGDAAWIAMALGQSQRQPGERASPNCSPRKVLMMKPFAMPPWQVLSSAIVQVNLSCSKLLPEETRCDCKTNLEGTCRSITIHPTCRCARPDGACQCTARDGQSSDGTGGVALTSGTADGSASFQELYDQVEAYLNAHGWN